MPSAEQLRKRLVKKLTELFQLDQPDLDFGFYRIMHARAREVQEFINNDLLQIVAEAFGDADEAQKAELKAKWEEEIRAAEAHGVPEPEDSPRVREAEAAYNAVKDSSGAEAAVYDHLYRFFERYYDNGDFISRRYHTRETSGKAAPFAIPYNGEEVKPVWANMDQYYIKTTEYFSNFTFDLTKAAGKQIEENLKRRKSEPEDLFDDINRPAGHLRVHFRVREATEGEHGNVKGSEQNRRYFIIHRETPVEFHEAGELVCNFEYRPDPDKTGTENKWQDTRNAEAVETITAKLKEAANSGIGQAGEYLRLLTIAAPTENEPTRPLLARYVKQYTARNTMDYFIHKDLGGFLRRELDFYIKNEVMSLDDIENADAPAVERYLDRIRVLRKIAGQLIDFLAQLENFQKKLWLKKKFVIETNYCVTLDRIIQGEEESEKERRWFAEQIAANDAQMDEWVKLGFIE